jgi:hypothetical protein
MQPDATQIPLPPSLHSLTLEVQVDRVIINYYKNLTKRIFGRQSGTLQHH